MGGDQTLVHVAGMTCRIANAVDAGHGGDPFDEIAQRSDAAGIVAMIGIDVLADQRDLAHAGFGERAHFIENGGDRTRHFGAARIGHNTESAEFIATFLHGDEGGITAPAQTLWRRRLHGLKLIDHRKIGIDHAAAAKVDVFAGLAEQFGETMIALRPNDDIDGTLAADDLTAFGLGDAPGDGDLHGLAVRRAFFLHLAQFAEFGEDFLRGAFADVTGVENDEIGFFRRSGRAIALAFENVAHARGVIDVHLASERLDENLASLRRDARRGPSRL